MKPMHGEVMTVGARNRCRCCATRLGRAGSKRNKRLNHQIAKAGKTSARQEAKRHIRREQED